MLRKRLERAITGNKLVLVVVLPTSEMAQKVAAELETKVLCDSGWHVYHQMEHVLNQRAATEGHSPWKHPKYLERGGYNAYKKGMLPYTDNLLSRAINISIGVWDAGLGSGYGVTVKDGSTEVDKSSERFRLAYEKYL